MILFRLNLFIHSFICLLLFVFFYYHCSIGPNTLCLKEMSSQKRNTQNLTLKEENSSRFYSWGLQRTVVKKSFFNSVLPRPLSFFCRYQTSPFPLRTSASVKEKVHTPLLGDDSGVVIVGLLIFSYQLNCWQAGYEMGRGVEDLCWTCLETCQNLATWFPYIAIWWINSKVPEGSMITRENSSATRESSRVIILKSSLNSTGHSACTSEVRGIFWSSDPCTQWMMTADVLQPWARRNSIRAPVRNITPFYAPTNKCICVCIHSNTCVYR